MPLHEEFERSGNWLFRWRSYLPVLLAIPMLVVMNQFDYPLQNPRLHEIWVFACMAISFLGLAIRALSIGFAPRGTSGRNTKCQVADELNMSGMYSLVRHPLYVGNFMIWLGISMFFMSWWLSLIFVLSFWVYYERIMFAEEAFLRRKFGDRYLQWAEKTPAFLPRFRRWERPTLTFSLRNILRREYCGFFAIVVCFFALEVGTHATVHNSPEIAPHWIVIFLLGLTVFLTLRTLKRKTTWLNVQGR